MLNSYTLETYKKENKPCFVVTVKHVMRAGVYFFNNLGKAKNFIESLKNELNPYAKLIYNSNGCTDTKYIELIKMVLSDSNIKIGKNGKTYM